MSKCGTSWWFSLILAHPDVHGPVKKELLFFNRNFFRQFRDRDCSDAELEAYHQWFPRPAGSTTGEWTPSYLFSYRLPPILQRAAPKAKLLVLLRDPVERYRSDISRRMPRRRLRNVRYRGLARGFYAAELAPWEEAYHRRGDAGPAVRGVHPGPGRRSWPPPTGSWAWTTPSSRPSSTRR